MIMGLFYDSLHSTLHGPLKSLSFARLFVFVSRKSVKFLLALEECAQKCVFSFQQKTRPTRSFFTDKQSNNESDCQ